MYEIYQKPAIELPPLKQHQERSIARLNALRTGSEADKGRAVLAVAPPGAGKSRVMLELARQEVDKGGRALILAHRRLLLSQLSQGFDAAGLEAGVVSPEYELNEAAPIQIASVQTLFARAIKKSNIELPDASLVMIDEAHQQAGKTALSLLFGAYSNGMTTQGYLHRGVDCFGFTATPLMKSRIYEELIDFASYSELRREKMHQLIKTYEPEEIDTTGLKPNQSGDFSERGLEKRAEKIVGSVYLEWKTLNPDARPALLFAPSVPSSKWFAYKFASKGVRVAHIDAETVLLPNSRGTLDAHPSSAEARAEVLRMSREGEISVVCNRFVLREAIDMPWLYHAIFATVMGSPTTFLQSVGRLQRYCPDYETKILQDHGGSYHRHGSANMNRRWKLGTTPMDYNKQRVERILRGEEDEGIRCEHCGMWRTRGDKCPSETCRKVGSQSVRAVRSAKGRLKLVKGPVHKKPSYRERKLKIWTSTLFMCGKSGKTVAAAMQIAKNRAAKEGITLDFESVYPKPPAATDSEIQKYVRDVYPWTVGKKA